MYKVNIGLEIHVELKTERKMFCFCLNDSEEKRPNFNVCPICLGEPGTLPVANKEAIEKIIKISLACNSKISNLSFFERKSYFYPDLPKGYQISQLQHPIGVGGHLEIQTANRDEKTKKIEIKEIHLEEDTARLDHSKDKVHSLIDFNRSGVPLMELVTAPNICSSIEAKNFAQELQTILRYLDISDANMEKGEMRVEANISLRLEGEDMGTKVEIKNLNSFRAVEKAIEYETKRQEKVLKSGKKIIQETRGWDENKKETFSQRAKESAADYRYFPEPDLSPFEIEEKTLDRIKKSLIELPYQKKKRYLEEYQLPLEQINSIIEEKEKADFFEKITRENKDKKFIKLASNYFTSDLFGLIQKFNLKISELKFNPDDFASLINLILEDKVQTSQAKNILEEMVKNGVEPTEIIEKGDIKKVSEEELEEIIKNILNKNQEVVKDFKSGKTKVLQFLIGQAMKETRGEINPNTIKKLFHKFLL